MLEKYRLLFALAAFIKRDRLLAFVLVTIFRAFSRCVIRRLSG